MKKIVTFLFLFLLIGCSTIRYVPIKGEEVVRTEYVTKDSIVVVPIERIVEVVPELDTLRLETSVAKAEAYLDTASRSLKGKIENKQNIIYKEKTVYKDSIVFQKQEIPVEVEVVKKVVPKWCWWLLGVNLLIIAIFIIRAYFKLKRVTL